jgi:hypothetical protein
LAITAITTTSHAAEKLRGLRRRILNFENMMASTGVHTNRRTTAAAEPYEETQEESSSS